MTSPPTTVLVTGAGGGLGKSIATTFLASGANVSVCDVDSSRLAATEAEWTDAGYSPSRFLTAAADVTDEAAVQRLVADTAAKFGGRLDVLVNNAGLMDDFSPVGSCTRESWDKVMSVNVLGPWHTCRAAIRQFEKQTAEGDGAPPGGVIVNVCSVAAKLGSVAGVAYTASKHVRKTFLFVMLLSVPMTSLENAWPFCVPGFRSLLRYMSKVHLNDGKFLLTKHIGSVGTE